MGVNFSFVLSYLDTYIFYNDRQDVGYRQDITPYNFDRFRNP